MAQVFSFLCSLLDTGIGSVEQVSKILCNALLWLLFPLMKMRVLHSLKLNRSETLCELSNQLVVQATLLSSTGPIESICLSQPQSAASMSYCSFQTWPPPPESLEIGGICLALMEQHRRPCLRLGTGFSVSTGVWLQFPSTCCGCSFSSLWCQ